MSSARDVVKAALRPLSRAMFPAVSAAAMRYAGEPRSMPPLLSRLLSLSGRPVLTTAKLVTGQAMVVNPFDTVGGEIFRHGCFEPETVEFIRGFLKPGMTFVDIGANIGQYSVMASPLVGPSGQVWSFEPAPATYDLLVRNLRNNNCQNAKALQIALTDTPGAADLHLGFGDNSGASSLRPTTSTSEQTVRVPTATLDDTLAGATRLDLIKIDVEGAELLVLKGAERTLREHGPSIVMEMTNARFTNGFGYSPRDIAQWLIERGYTVYRIEGSALEPYAPAADDPAWYNVLCTRRMHAADPPRTN